ncbi:MAG: hypothetical protein R3C19_22380 [Planctomycetaceae bacterium]
MAESGAGADARGVDSKKEKARELWERLGNSRPGPDNKDLLYLARFVPLLSNAAAKTLLSRKLSLDELKEMIQYVPKAQDAAMKLALKFPPEDLSENDLRFIVTHTKSADAAKVLLKRHPNEAALAFVERTVEGMQETVDRIRAKELTRDVLKEIDRAL